MDPKLPVAGQGTPDSSVAVVPCVVPCGPMCSRKVPVASVRSSRSPVFERANLTMTPCVSCIVQDLNLGEASTYMENITVNLSLAAGCSILPLLNFRLAFWNFVVSWSFLEFLEPKSRPMEMMEMIGDILPGICQIHDTRVKGDCPLRKKYVPWKIMLGRRLSFCSCPFLGGMFFLSSTNQDGYIRPSSSMSVWDGFNLS